MPKMTYMNKGLTIEALKTALYYDPWTGIFTWLKARRVIIGGRAGQVCRAGHIRISVCGVMYYAGPLAWFYVHGRWPNGEVDHINNDPSDNRIANLREATREQNTQNAKRRRDNSTGFIGVSYRKDMKQFIAEHQTAGRRVFLGFFDTAEAASAAYQTAIAVRGEFAYREAS